MSAISTWHPSLGAHAPRRATRPRPARGVVARWAPFFAGLAAVAALVWWVTNSRVFDVREVAVDGNAWLSGEEVARLAGVDRGTNVLWTSPSEVERRLEAVPWISRATVSRTFPSSVSISIVERTPVALLEKSSLLVASDGTVLGEAASVAVQDADELSRLPRIAVTVPSGTPPRRLPPATPQLIAAASMPSKLLGEVAEIRASGTGATVLGLRDGTRVLFGSAARAEEKWRVLRAVLGWARKNGVTAASIDLRAPTAPSLRPASTVVPEALGS